MGRDQIPDYDWERLSLDELPDGRLEEIRRHPEFDTQRSAAMSRIRQSDAELLERYPADVMATRIRERMQVEEVRNEGTPASGGSILRTVVGNPRLAAGVAALLLIAVGIMPLMWLNTPVTPERQPESTRIKGLKPDIRIYREQGGDPELLHENDLVRENDLLQIGYVSGGWKHGAIFSIDGNGAVTLHYPADIFSTTHLSPEGEIKLPYSYQLDSAPEFERFFFVLSDKEFSVNEILLYAEELVESRSVRSIRSLSLPRGYEQASIVLKKGASE